MWTYPARDQGSPPAAPAPTTTNHTLPLQTAAMPNPEQAQHVLAQPTSAPAPAEGEGEMMEESTSSPLVRVPSLVPKLALTDLTQYQGESGAFYKTTDRVCQGKRGGWGRALSSRYEDGEEGP